MNREKFLSTSRMTLTQRREIMHMVQTLQTYWARVERGRTRFTIDYLGAWEQLYNPNFKLVEFNQFFE